jgi:hypothetical protein
MKQTSEHCKRKTHHKIAQTAAPIGDLKGAARNVDIVALDVCRDLG